MIIRLSAILGVLLLAACAVTPGASPSLQPTAPPTPSPTPDSAFYLRAWNSQALPPRETFAWLPMVTIVDRTLIEGNVAVPAIFPGPLMISPLSRSISDAGVSAIVDEARRLGLLSGQTDFAGEDAVPGSRLGHIEMVIDGTSYSLTGLPDALVRCGGARCEAEPGTPGAFAAFWQELSMLDSWLAPELGAPDTYAPERVALLLGAPAQADGDLPLNPVEWPFDQSLAESGVDFPGGAGERCLSLSGDDLALALPGLQSGTQLTVFVDEAGGASTPIVRVLVPREQSPCPDGVAM